MPGAGWSSPKPLHWRCMFRWWLDPWRRHQGRWDTLRWLIWAEAEAKPEGLLNEVQDFFWSHVKAGYHPSIAAHWALEEWDI